MEIVKESEPECRCLMKFLHTTSSTGSLSMIRRDSRINKIPPELMIKIFEHCIELNEVVNPFLDLCTLGAVCEEWRKLIIETPSLWTGIELFVCSTGDRVKKIQSKAIGCISNSKGCSLSMDENNSVFFDHDTMKLLHERGHVKETDGIFYYPIHASSLEEILRSKLNVIVTYRFDWIEPVLTKYGDRVRRLEIRTKHQCRIFSNNSTRLFDMSTLDLTISSHEDIPTYRLNPDELVRLVPNITSLILRGKQLFGFYRTSRHVKDIVRDHGFKKLESLELDSVGWDQAWNIALLIGCSKKLRKLTLRNAEVVEDISFKDLWKDKKVEELTMIYNESRRHLLDLSKWMSVCGRNLKTFTFSYVYATRIGPTRSICQQRSLYIDDRMRALNRLYNEGRNTTLTKIDYKVTDMETDEASLVDLLKELCKRNCESISQS